MDLKLSIEETKNLLQKYYSKIMVGGNGKKVSKKKSKRLSKNNKILNPITGRYVKRDGKIGKQILSMKNDKYVDIALKKKSKRK